MKADKLIPCRKVKYDTKKEARQAAKEFNQLQKWYKGKKERKKRVRAYLCRTCHKWHLTSHK